MAKEKEDRNKLMYEDNTKRNLSYSELAIKYKMSYNNVARIIQNYKFKNNK